MSTFIESVWYGDRGWARGIRWGLLPFSALFRGIVAVRNFGYDLGLLQSIASPMPVLSIGNISVGGTGKTPVAAFFARLLQARGYLPAIVMRGYGDDEPLVHSILSPGVPVYANADRVEGISAAIHQGATAIVLDDAFQHRRAERDSDIVLVSAERWGQSFLLPAGPLREPRHSLRRAALVLVTHRIAAWPDVQRVIAEVRACVPHVPVASVHLRLDQLVPIPAEHPSSEPPPAPISLDSLRGTQVLAIAGIGDPDAFFRQLNEAGTTVDTRSFPDHHPYSLEDVARLISDAKDHKYIVTTLKDVVKLHPLWAPKAPLLWYVSQAVDVTSGDSLIDATVNNIFPFR